MGFEGGICGWVRFTFGRGMRRRREVRPILESEGLVKPHGRERGCHNVTMILRKDSVVDGK